jgi:hypothetical protein
VLVLFDHGTPKGLALVPSEHTVHTAQSKGWDTLNNGALLNAAEEAGFDLLLNPKVGACYLISRPWNTRSIRMPLPS